MFQYEFSCRRHSFTNAYIMNKFTLEFTLNYVIDILCVEKGFRKESQKKLDLYKIFPLSQIISCLQKRFVSNYRSFYDINETLNVLFQLYIQLLF